MFSILSKRNILIATSATIGIAFFGTNAYNKHTYDQELFNRMNYLIDHPEELSGIYLAQRQPFGFLSYLQWLLPYHQSLVIKDGGIIRHVGIARRAGNSTFNFTSEFVLHVGGNYETLNSYDTLTPIEAWVDFNRKFGYYPKPNKGLLMKLTMTRSEATTDDERAGLFHNVFGKLSYGYDNTIRFESCRSAVMDVIYLSQLDKQNGCCRFTTIEEISKGISKGQEE